ncbi:MAG: GNAT family protein [Solirubrobacteraceae bacterium]|jgi:RimJ/RimL family protein N-acetyltransferase
MSVAQPSNDRAPSVSDLRGRLEGRLVVLEPLSIVHEQGLAEAARDGELFTWIPAATAAAPAAAPRGARSPTRGWILSALETTDSGDDVPFAILDAGTGEPLGATRFLEIRLDHLRVEIGWMWLARPAWRTGAGIEAKLLLMGRAFETAGFRRVEFKTDALNARSRAALEALGATFEGVMRKHMVVKGGAARDSAYYSVIDDEWPAFKQRLERRLERLNPAPRG